MSWNDVQSTPPPPPAPRAATYNPADPSYRQLAPGIVQQGRQIYAVGPDGSLKQIHDLDAGSQAANAMGVATGLQGNYNQAFGREMSLADMLNNTIENVNAPSVAQEQLKEGLQANTAAQLAGAAGASGENAFMARRTAANNIAGLGAATNQASALTRAQEVSNAQQGLGGLLQGAASTAGGLGQGYTNEAGSLELGGNANVTAKNGQYIDLGKSAATGGGSLLGSGATSSGAGAGAAGGGAALASDRRIKHDVAPESDANEESFARALQPDSFEYDGQRKKRHGVMAQDVEKGGPIGRALVGEDASGVKGLDVAQGLGAALSLLGYLHKKIEKLEADRG